MRGCKGSQSRSSYGGRKTQGEEPPGSYVTCALVPSVAMLRVGESLRYGT